MENFIFVRSATIQLGQQLRHRCLAGSLSSTYNPLDFSVKIWLKNGHGCEYVHESYILILQFIMMKPAQRFLPKQNF